MKSKKKSLWLHPKNGKTYVSSYDIGKYSNDRIFTLSYGGKVISFESWQAAKKAGWVKL